jgi:predicted ATPase
MLKSIKLINFKAAENLGIRFGALTVLAGLNSSGKSSVLQGLAVLKQTVAAGDIDALLLRGPLVQLGTYSDVYTEGAESEGISIEIEDDLRSYLWRCSGASSDSYLTFSAKDGLNKLSSDGRPNVHDKFH